MLTALGKSVKEVKTDERVGRDVNSREPHPSLLSTLPSLSPVLTSFTDFRLDKLKEYLLAQIMKDIEWYLRLITTWYSLYWELLVTTE